MQRLSRRSVIQGGAAAVAAAGLSGLAACSGGNKSASSANKANKAVKLPTYVTYEGVKPDLDGTDPGLDGFLKYPAKPVRVIQEPPGDGKPVTFLTNIPGAIPPTEGKNQFWQELNKRVGSELKISMATNDEYPTKFQTTLASGDLPDIINIPTSAKSLPSMLKATSTDLTEHVSGDAVKKYPFLANLPPLAWKGCVYDGAIYAIPVPRGLARTSLAVYRADLLEKKGITNPAPANFDELLDFSKQANDPKHNHWAWSLPPVDYIRQMLRIPYIWSEKGGKFSSANVAEEQPDALEATRKMIVAGVINPDGLSADATTRKQWFNGGQVSFDLASFVGWTQYYTENTAGPSFSVDALDFMGFDGGEGGPWLGLAINNRTSFNKKSSHSVETLLKIANWMAAPFGTEEYLFRHYGVQGEQYQLEGTDPVQNHSGELQTGIGIQYICDAPQTYYFPGKPEVPQRQFALQQKIVNRLVEDPSYGLFSPTADKQLAVINGPLGDTQTQILQGKQPVSAWKEAVQTWRKSGGDKIRDELEQAYAEVNG